MTGVLPIGLVRSTRVMPIVVHSLKEYVCVMELHGSIGTEELSNIVTIFKGAIYQRPPLKSSVRRALRKRTIYDIEILEIKNRHLLLRIVSDPGTYMRKLCHDIGILAGVGAHMRELRRTRTGPFTEDHAITLHRLSEAVYLWKMESDENLLRRYIYPVETAACELPKAIVKDTAVSSILHGSGLYPQGIAAFTKDIDKSKLVALFTSKGELISIAKPDGGYNEWEKRVRENSKSPIARPKVNIMERDAYPKTWKNRGQVS